MLHEDLSIIEQSNKLLMFMMMTEKFVQIPDIEDVDDLLVEDFLTYRLVTLTNRLNRQAKQILEEAAALRLPEWRCLAFIKRCRDTDGKASLHQLADATSMDRALISRSVQGLVEKGHVLTERNRDDRRIVHAVLTRQGEALYRDTLPIMQRRQHYLLNALSSQERKAVYRIIERLNLAVEEWEAEQATDEAS